MEKKSKSKIARASPGKHFTLADGTSLSNFIELVHALEKMSAETFKHHVTETKNDFSNWINDVFDDHELGDELAKKKTKTETHVAVMQHVINKLTK